MCYYSVRSRYENATPNLGIREVFSRLHFRGRHRHTFASFWGSWLRFASLWQTKARGAHVLPHFDDLTYLVIRASSALIILAFVEVWLVSFAAVIRVVTQRSSPQTAAHSSSAFLSSNWPIRNRLPFSEKLVFCGKCNEKYDWRAANNYVHVIGSQ